MNQIIFVLNVSKEYHLDSKHTILPIANTDYADILKSENDSSQYDESYIQACIETIEHQPSYPSDTCCFWDCHPFSGHAFCIPVHYNTYANKYSGEGHFCSPGCALAFVFDSSLPEIQKWQRRALITQLYGPTIKAAPRATLKMFGGVLNIRQFRQLKRVLVEAHAPIRLYMPSVSMQAKELPSFKPITDQLRLKRKTKESQTALERCLTEYKK